MSNSKTLEGAAQDEPSYGIATEVHDLCADEYVALMAEGWDASPLNVPTPRPGIRARCWHVGSCMLTEYDMSPFLFETKRVHLQNRGKMATLRKFVSGFEIGDYANGEFYCGPGSIQVGDPLSTGKAISSALTIQEIFLPRSMLGLPDARLAQREKVYELHRAGQIAHAEWNLLFRELNAGTNQIEMRHLDLLIASVILALGVNPQREDVRAQARELLFRHIERFIFSHLRSPDLSSAMLLDHFGVSRASLYRMFGPLGGVSTHIAKLRASRALIDIWQNRALRGSVSAARERWGFQTGNDFNRTVRRLFGNSPKQLLVRNRATNPHVKSASDFAFNFVDMRFMAGTTHIAA